MYPMLTEDQLQDGLLRATRVLKLKEGQEDEDVNEEVATYIFQAWATPDKVLSMVYEVAVWRSTFGDCARLLGERHP